MCKKYAKDRLGITDFDIYQDEGFSGGNTDRPQFQKMMKEIKEKKYTHLICYRLDRISRSVADFSVTLELLYKLDVSFISIKEQFDTSSSMGRAMLNISATFAQFERETIAERIKDNLRELAKTGRWLGGPAPLGYRSIAVENSNSDGKSRKKHILEINANEIEAAKLTFQLFIKYKSYMKVCAEFEKLGIKTRKNLYYSRNMIKQTINNPVYAIADKKLLEFFKNHGCKVYNENKINGSNGIMPYNRREANTRFKPIKEWVISVGEHPGIISGNDWVKCQDIRKEIEEKASNRQCTSQEALLSGLVVCGKCGSGMAPRQNKNGKYHYRYYSCNARNKSASRCNNDALNAYDAEEAVVKYLKSLKVEDIIENYEKNKAVNKSKIDNNKAIENYKKEIEINKTAISKLVKKIAFLDDDLAETFFEEIKNIKNKNIELETKIVELENKNDKLTDAEESLEDILACFDNFKRFYDFTEKFEDKQRLIRSVVKFITWNSETEYLDIVLIGSNKKRPVPNSNLPFHL